MVRLRPSVRGSSIIQLADLSSDSKFRLRVRNRKRNNCIIIGQAGGSHTIIDQIGILHFALCTVSIRTTNNHKRTPLAVLLFQEKYWHRQENRTTQHVERRPQCWPPCKPLFLPPPPPPPTPSCTHARYTCTYVPTIPLRGLRDPRIY